MKKLLIALIITSILFGCKKSSTEEEYYTVTGQVLDLDSKLPIVGATAYLSGIPPASDSALTDALGRVTFRYRVGERSRIFYVVKNGYLRPINYYAGVSTSVSRTDTFFLARPSFVNVTAHRIGSYLVSDTIEIQVAGDNVPSIGETNGYRILHRDKANAPDKLYNLQAVYNVNYSFWNQFLGHEKLYFIKNIIRSGSVISTNTDSTNIIQFSTQNFTLNY
jgi:hypothetical protein